MNLFGFTKQEYDIIRKLLKITKKVNVTVCTDSLILDKNPEIDIFYSNKQTAEKLMNIANEEDVKIEKSVFLDNKKARFKSEELLHIEQNLYSIKQRKYEELPKNLSIFLANNQYSEVEYVASKIVELVKEKKYRYKDISIITKNLDTYSNLCKAIFDEYDIPVFIDQKKDLSDNILVQYILAVLDIFSKNWSHEAVFNYIKTGFLQMEQEDIYELENFCMKWGIKQTKWYKGEWNFKEDSKNDEDRLEKMKNLRKLIVDPLLNFKIEVDRSRDVTTITKCLYDFLIKNKIDEKLENKIKVKIEEGNNEAAAEYKTSYKILMDVLDEIVLVFGNDKITFDKYMQILKIGLGNSGLGKIPASCDQVIVGDVDRSRSHKVKAIFIIGLNDGMFPSINRNEGYFNDKDREYLKTNGIELAKGTLDRLYEDNFNIYKAFTTSEEKLFLSYSSSDSEGKSLRPSIIIAKIKKIFSNIKEESDILEKKFYIVNEKVTFDELLVNLRNLKDGIEIEEYWYDIFSYFYQNEKWKYKLENSLKGIYFTNKTSNISEEAINKLYGNVLRTSISRLEQYRACPFSYYLKYRIKIIRKKHIKNKFNRYRFFYA
ncbi:MAG: exodeoxyribonuclease V subunit gamma [Clostridia bacterium]|jgi:ATP-dependent helicase/nuclease subunit B|nr:aTP-dependent helicase/deoxyribonuclease subunit B [Clostridium sp. CAG:571]HJJ13696.1 exodeoxyribonuclease V subunit gamma [Clostridiaceae bacterium]